MAVAKHADVDGTASSSGSLYEIVGVSGASTVFLAQTTSLITGELSPGSLYAMAQTPADVSTDFSQSAASPAEVYSAACIERRVQ